MKPHVIGQGESAVTLAVRRRFDLDEVWNHPKNARLKDLRKDPHVLCSGDILYLPDHERSWLSPSVGAENTFVVNVPRLHTSISCQGPDGQPLANQAYVVDGDGEPTQGTTDGDGVAIVSFSSHRDTVRLRFPDIKFVVVAKVAHLDPVTEPSGVDQRLAALGLLKPAPPLGTSAAAQEVVAAEYRAAALRAFQTQNGLPATGELDDAT
ncbi:MAG: peptidoglycan-binding protein, partial [Polyangiaceae bacterium]